MANPALSLLVLKTRQVEQLRLFYQTLGIQFVEEHHGKGPKHFAGRVGDVVIEIYPLADDRGAVDTFTRLGFAVEKLNELVEVLRKIDVKIVKPPQETPWGFQCVVKDPDGRTVELTERR